MWVEHERRWSKREEKTKQIDYCSSESSPVEEETKKRERNEEEYFPFKMNQWTPLALIGLPFPVDVLFGDVLINVLLFEPKLDDLIFIRSMNNIDPLFTDVRRGQSLNVTPSSVRRDWPEA